MGKLPERNVAVSGGRANRRKLTCERKDDLNQERCRSRAELHSPPSMPMSEANGVRGIPIGRRQLLISTEFALGDGLVAAYLDGQHFELVRLTGLEKLRWNFHAGRRRRQHDIQSARRAAAVAAVGRVSVDGASGWAQAAASARTETTIHEIRMQPRITIIGRR